MMAIMRMCSAILTIAYYIYAISEDLVITIYSGKLSIHSLFYAIEIFWFLGLISPELIFRKICAIMPPTREYRLDNV